MKTLVLSLTVLTALYLSTAGYAAPVGLNTWTAESYQSLYGFSPGVWTVSPDGNTVTQSQNGQPTLFYSDFEAMNTSVTGRIRVTKGSDDDFIGFALGFNPGDASNSAADYLLVDWKSGTQTYDFRSPSSSSGGTASAGLAVSHVTGIPDADEFWQHANLGGTSTGSGLEELARATNLGNTGWTPGTEYKFDLYFTSTNLQVFVDDVLEMNISGDFSNGRLAFYNFSQADVEFSSFNVDSVPEPSATLLVDSVPEPSATLLLGIGLIGLTGYGWRLRKREAVQNDT